MKLLGYFVEVWEKENNRNSIENVWLPGDYITGEIIIHQTCPDLGCCEVLVEFTEPILFNKILIGAIQYAALEDAPDPIWSGV